jgi:DNA invertase Pin-like site-specific DNA recombinase
MIGFNNDAGPAGSVSSYSPAPQSSGASSSAPAPSRRGRVRSADFGMPERPGLLDLARTYLETQARLWPDLVGTAAVPAADAATIAAMADDFERRFRQQSAEAFRPAGTPIAWIALAVAYLRFSDENSNPRSLDQQLLNVLNRARREGVFVPWCYVLADAAVSGTLACRTGYTLAKTIVERRDEFGVSWFLIDDLSRMSRNTIESLRLGELAAATGVRVVGASDGFDSSNPQSSLLLPVLGSMNEAFVTQLKAKVRRGMDDAFRRGDNIQPPGVGYRMVTVTTPDGSPMITHKGTIEKQAEVDPDTAAWIVRGAELIARAGKSPIEVARLLNEQKVGGRQTWSDNMIRKLYSRERLVGREVFRTTRQEKSRTSGKVRYVKLPQDQWLVRESPHLRILPDELADAVRAKLNLAAQSFGGTAKDRTKKARRADLYPKVLIRPICGDCGTPMILGRSLGRYQSFCCFNALHGIHSCTNRGYKSARIIDEAVLSTVMATLFTDDFLADLTADVNKRLAWIARQPIPSTKKLEQEIANEDRQLKRLTDRLAKLDDTHLDAVLSKAEEMGRQLAAKREQLRGLQRASRRPKVKSVKEKDVVAALTHLRDLLQGDVGVAAQVLKALVGDVILEARQIEGQAKPQMVARFTINTVPALAALERGKPTDRDVAPAPVWDSIHSSPGDAPATAAVPAEAVVPLTYDRREAARKLRNTKSES